MQHCAGFISAESLYVFRAQAPIIRSISGVSFDLYCDARKHKIKI